MPANATSTAGDYAPLEGWSRKVKLPAKASATGTAEAPPRGTPVAVSVSRTAAPDGAVEETAGCARFRVKSSCVVEGFAWLRSDTVYRGHDCDGEVSTVRLWNPEGPDSLEVLRGSVIRLTETGLSP